MFPSQNYFLNGTNYKYSGVGNLRVISQSFLYMWFKTYILFFNLLIYSQNFPLTILQPKFSATNACVIWFIGLFKSYFIELKVKIHETQRENNWLPTPQIIKNSHSHNIPVAVIVFDTPKKKNIIQQQQSITIQAKLACKNH